MIEQLINEQVSNDTQIKGMLTTYKGNSAFFYQKSPQDSDTGWEKPCYPRADFNIDMQYDPERKTAGVLSINIWCTNECSAVGDNDPDRAIEKRLVELIGGTFYTGEGKATVCAVWNRSDAFDFERSAIAQSFSTPEVFGITMLFDLTEFPEQITTTPDPIQGVNSWTKTLFPQMTVIAHDHVPAIWKPTDANRSTCSLSHLAGSYPCCIDFCISFVSSAADKPNFSPISSAKKSLMRWSMSDISVVYAFSNSAKRFLNVASSINPSVSSKLSPAKAEE